MIRYSSILIGVLCLCYNSLATQVNMREDIDTIGQDSVGIDTLLLEGNVPIVNADVLNPVFRKLQLLQENGDRKVRMVQIGDSHIQAGWMTGEIRKWLQATFGNAGLGFVFPLRLAQSNGIDAIRCTSTARWIGKRNIFAERQDPVGLSGFSLTTNKENCAIRLRIEDERYAFNTIKLFTPHDQQMFVLAKALRPIDMDKHRIVKKVHCVRSGETLSHISRKYGVSVREIKAANNLHSSLIHVGDKLYIPMRMKSPEPLDREDFDILPMLDTAGYYSYTSPRKMTTIWLLPQEGLEKYALNGIVLENDSAGIIFGGIGVNGARFYDYNQTPLFFTQLQKLKPDLIVMSLGTNEAYYHSSVDDYFTQIRIFTDAVRKKLPDAVLLFTTPPPFLYDGRHPSKLAAEYAERLVEIADEMHIAVWNLHEALGGNAGIAENDTHGLVARDHIHFTEAGYRYSGRRFVDAFMRAYSFYLYKMR